MEQFPKRLQQFPMKNEWLIRNRRGVLFMNVTENSISKTMKQNKSRGQLHYYVFLDKTSKKLIKWVNASN